MEPAQMFSTLTLMGDDLPQAITLSRAGDFPACQYHSAHSTYRVRLDWEPSPRPKDGSLTLKLGKRIGDGRSAVVYAAEVLTTSDEHNVLRHNLLPPEETLCVKIARPNRCRTLARESWVYDQIYRRGHMQGIIAPHTYGFFTADLSSQQLTFPLWSSQDFTLEHHPAGSQDDSTRDDRLPDDEALGVHKHRPGGKELSSWDSWRPDPDAPLLAVLVMSRGGATYTVKDDADEAMQEDMCAILDDLSDIYLWHTDLRSNNLVRAPCGTKPCEKHGRVHTWNIIDFAWTVCDDKDGDLDELKLVTIRELQQGSHQEYYFWTGFCG
ncbi:uncharacterized protein C8Q71DRAFT_3090 [Rhodofomes roseus]|uniref:Protein kinase domain-containing protein n=1 Tax=Rhodofomes roseus TaxID=34475 RepID=A0ABQ8KWX9_9APHY|nr:uncharacterized protein C8Q71DRAFT_3090 [Rhodofomes roseus]KAH9843533.1 hypothetical protein C8Q71DRAFT_3090 [Rhodofomes roseus]